MNWSTTEKVSDWKVVNFQCLPDKRQTTRTFNVWSDGYRSDFNAIVQSANDSRRELHVQARGLLEIRLHAGQSQIVCLATAHCPLALQSTERNRTYL
jgi:hypothetical protein